MELYTERRNLGLWNPMWFHIPAFISGRDWKMLVLQQLWRCIVAANIVPSESQLISHHFTFTKLFIWEVQVLSSLTADPKHQQHLKLYFEFTSHNVHASFCKVPPLACLSFRVHKFGFPEALTAATPPTFSQISSFSSKWSCTSKHRSIQNHSSLLQNTFSPTLRAKQLLNNNFIITILPPKTRQGFCSKGNRRIHVSRIKLIF